MSPVSTVAFVGLLVAIFLALVAVLVWQEAKRRGNTGPPVYAVEDAVDFVAERLSGTGLTKSDVKRVIEWEVFYLQGLAQKQRWRPVETVAGGDDAAVEFITRRIAEVHGVTYAQDDIRAVLRLEADYLVSIGAVGDPVDVEDLPGGEST